MLLSLPNGKRFQGFLGIEYSESEVVYQSFWGALGTVQLA